MPKQRVPAPVMAVAFVLLSLVATAARTDRIDDFVRERMKEFSVPSVSMAIVEDGKIAKLGSYGLADVARGTAAAPETVYKIGSVSKQFIATGIMLLAQDGRLKVDDPISRHLEGTPPAWQPITIRHLSTVEDLAKWDALLYTDKFLSEASRREMWTPARLNDGTATFYGFGWNIQTMKNGRQVVQHGGSLPGFRAYMARFINEKVTVIVLTNADDVDAAAIANGAADIYLTDRQQQTAQPAPARGNVR